MFIPAWSLVVVLCALLVFCLWFSRKDRQPSFAPYYITISPNWFQILSDHNLVDENSWRTLRQNAETTRAGNPGSYNVLLHSYSFTVLWSDRVGVLVYSNVQQHFRTEIDFREPIDGLYVSRAGNGHDVRGEFWIKWGVDRELATIDLGITTPESWRKVVMVGDGNERVTVARIPLAVFTTTNSHWTEPLKAAVNRLGWSIDKMHEDWKQGVMGHSEEVLEHKYFTVQYDWI